MAKQQQFTVVLTTTSTVPVLVDYMTMDLTATQYIDYNFTQGTLTFAPGEKTKTIFVNILADTTLTTLKQFKLVLSNAREGTIGTGSATAQISGPPAITPVAFPGRRLALLGDSITFMNNHWNMALPASYGSSVLRYESYIKGMTGYSSVGNELANNNLELEAAMQPNTNPGVNSTAPKNGYNFAVYSSQAAQLDLPDFDPLAAFATPSTLAHMVGPLYNALQYITKFDIAEIMIGTNDLSGGLDWQTTLAQIISAAIQISQAGKWVFLYCITPRSADLLQYNSAGAGYSQAQIVTIMQNLLNLNAGIRTFCATNPGNIFLVDAFSSLVGPTATIIAGTPTDPAGHLSPSSGIVSGSYIPSTRGNFRSDAPNAVMCFDGLHPASPGAYVIGKVRNAAMTAAGVPATIAGQLGPLTIGTNWITNSGFAVSTTPRVAGQPLLLGRAIGLGAPITNSSHPTPVAPLAVDAHANVGLGYTYGQVPDKWFIYRMTNGNDFNSSTAESYSNFQKYVFTGTGADGLPFVGTGPNQVPPAYVADSTWADGCLVSSIVTDASGRKGLQLVFNVPEGTGSNEGFIVRYTVAEGQHGPYDNYGYETGATAAIYAPPYNPGDYVGADAEIHYTGISGKLITGQPQIDFHSINTTQVGAGNYDTTGAVITGIGHAPSYFPFSNIVNCWEHPEDKIMFQRTPAVQVPTPASGETVQYAEVTFGFTMDCSTQAGSVTITIFNPRMAKLTGATL